MKKYSETGIMGAYVIVGCLFLMISILTSKGVKINFLDINYKRIVKGIENTVDGVKDRVVRTFHQSKNSKKSGSIHKEDTNQHTNAMLMLEAGLQNFVKKTDVAEISKGRLVLYVPGGVSESNITIKKDLIHKSIAVQFPKGMGNYDYSKNINEADGISSVDYKVSESMITVSILMNGVMDCYSEFENNRLVCDFFSPAELVCPVLVIDAGHGGYDVGAVEGEVYEKDIDLQICMKLRELFVNENMAVYYTRLDDSYPTVEQRVDFANEIMPALFISIHANWYEERESNGSSVLYNTKDEAAFNSMRLSEIMCEELTKACGTYNRGIVAGNDIHIVRHSAVPVALLEVGFMSNSSDLKILTSQPGQDRIALGIYNGIMKALTEMEKY